MVEKPDGGDDYSRRCAVGFSVHNFFFGYKIKNLFVFDASPGRSLRKKELPSFCKKGKYDAHPHCDLNGTV